MLKSFLSATAFILVATTSMADAASSKASASGAWNFSEARVGQVFDSATSSVCGAALVGADLVLTAAHCVIADESADPVDPRRLTFSYSDESGQAQVVKVIDIATDPKFVRRSVPSRDQIGRDVAMLRLGEYLSGDFEEMAGLDAQQPFVALLPTTDSAPFVGEPCAADYEDDRIVVLSCARAKGSSGMPAYSLIDGERKIVAVVSANGSRKGDKITFAVNPVQSLQDLQWISATRPVPGEF